MSVTLSNYGTVISTVWSLYIQQCAMKTGTINSNGNHKRETHPNLQVFFNPL